MPLKAVHLDIESRSAVDLRRTGVYRYAEDASTDIWCVCFSIDDGPIELWVPGQDCPPVIHEAAGGGLLFYAHNANFERVMTRHILAPKYGWPEPRLEQWRCTMVMALAMGFPAALERLAPALGLDITKDAQGAGVMMRLARPRKIEDDGRIVWWEDEERKQRLYEYCKTDVEVERAVHKRLCPLTASEQELWFLDQKWNDRGLYIDAKLCNAAKTIVSAAAKRLNANMVEATDGLVQSCSNIGQLSNFLSSNGVEMDSLRRDKVATLLTRRDLPDAVRDALELRQDAAKASVKKVDAALAGCSADGRAKGLFFFNGATTGRWAGRRVQPQNLARPAYGVDVDELIGDILTGDYDVVNMLHGAPLAAIGNAIRGIVAAAPGNELIAADFSNIESRVLAWLAGEQHALDKFHAGLDVYKVAYGSAFGIAPEAVNSDQRQIGKVIVLALGFGGGVGAFLSAAKLYQVDIGRSYGLLRETAPEIAKRAEETYDQRGKAGDTPRETWIAAEIVKLGWRDAHPNIVKFWDDLNEGALKALDNPNEKVPVGNLCFLKRGSFMWLQLPSGRPLCYPYPRLSEREMPWKDNRTGKPATRMTFTYRTEINRQWVDSHAYGGLWAENVTQATARDLLAEAMKRLEHRGFPIVSHAHDEAVAEVPAGLHTVETFCGIMSEVPRWATGLPIAAAGWRGPRYRKA